MFKLTDFRATLLFPEFPSTIVGSDGHNPVMIEWVDLIDYKHKYLFYKVKKEDLKSFINGKISHTDLIRSAIGGEYYFFYNDEYYMTSLSIIPSEYLPSENFFLTNNDIVDLQIINKEFGF